MPMKTYTVNVVYTMVHTMHVEAESAEEAKTKAMETFCDETDLMDDEIDSVDHANIVYECSGKTYPVRYRGCYRHGGRPDPDDPKVGRIEFWPMEQILDEINGSRSNDWTPYTEEDWREGLDEWTEWEPVEESEVDVCGECGSLMDYADSPMLKDDVWKQIHPGSEYDEDGVWKSDKTCLSCMEKKLGRKITLDDLGRDDFGRHLKWNHDFLKRHMPEEWRRLENNDDGK